MYNHSMSAQRCPALLLSLALAAVVVGCQSREVEKVLKVTNVEIKHVDLNESMVRAIAKQAEAERLRRAKVINSEGEQQAAEKLVEAGRALAQEPRAMQLRYFAALHDIAGDRSSTVVFPLPVDLLAHLRDSVATASGPGPATEEKPPQTETPRRLRP